ncbi:MAG TPA: ATP-dependent zinc metalloprotease FtsH [Steroidobacteraceae bacterium]
MENKQHQFTLWYFIGAFLLLIAVQTYLANPPAATIPYSDFMALVRAGKMQDVVVGSDTIEGTANVAGAQKIVSASSWKTIAAHPAEQPPPSTAAHPAPAKSNVAPTAAPSAPTGKGAASAVKTPEAAPPTAPRAQTAPDVHRLIARRVEDPRLTEELDAAHVQYQAANENHWFSTLVSWVLPAVIFVAVWQWAMRRGMGTGGGMGSLMQVGQSKAKVYVESETRVRFADVAGIDEAKAELEQIVEFLRNPDRYRSLGGKIPKGVLIVGAPGTGKTLLAKAVAGEAGVPFLSISGSEFVEMFVGVGAARVRDLFEQAEKRAPAIIFIDELDALGKARGLGGFAGGNDEREQTLNQLLVQMDGFDTRKGVIIMAATNRPEILDPALLRPGRFDRQVAIDRPDLKGREQILKVHTRSVKLGPDVDLGVVAAKTPGFVGADLANIVNEAALRAASAGKQAVEMRDFDEAIDRVVAGLERRNRVMNATEKETVAYHEAGHALVAESRRFADRVSKISIIPRGIGALGYTQQLPTEDRYLMKRSELLDRLDVLLGGRVAEELVYGDISTGAQDDLQRATDMARHMVTQYGMSERLGPVTFETPRQAYLNLPDGSQRTEYSTETAHLIDEEIARIIHEAHERVVRTLTERRATLDALAQLLLEKEVIDRATLDELLRRAGTPPVPAQGPARVRLAPTGAAATSDRLSAS